MEYQWSKEYNYSFIHGTLILCVPLLSLPDFISKKSGFLKFCIENPGEIRVFFPFSTNPGRVRSKTPGNLASLTYIRGGYWLYPMKRKKFCRHFIELRSMQTYALRISNTFEYISLSTKWPTFVFSSHSPFPLSYLFILSKL